jgi:hypothetical protein
MYQDKNSKILYQSNKSGVKLVVSRSKSYPQKCAEGIGYITIHN